MRCGAMRWIDEVKQALVCKISPARCHLWCLEVVSFFTGMAWRTGVGRDKMREAASTTIGTCTGSCIVACRLWVGSQYGVTVSMSLLVEWFIRLPNPGSVWPKRTGPGTNSDYCSL